MYELLKGSQPLTSQTQGGQEGAPTKVTNKYVENFERLLCAGAYKPVSYTHLTLPTIYSV